MIFKFQKTFIILLLLLQSIFCKGYTNCEDQGSNANPSCAGIGHNQDDTYEWDYELELCRKATNFILSSSFDVKEAQCNYILYELKMETGVYSCPQQPMNLIHGIIQECHAFEEFKHIKKEKVMYDYVSNYNWEEASLADLPWQIDSWQAGSWHYANFIDSLEIADYSGSLLDMYLMTIEFYDGLSTGGMLSFQGNAVDISSCNFEPLPHRPNIYRLTASFYNDGYGETICKKYESISDCNRNLSTPHCFEVRIFPDRIKYGDVNFDGYMDIFMPFANIGAGSMQLGYNWIYLTRTSPNQNIFKVIKPLNYKAVNLDNDILVMINDILSFNNSVSFSTNKISNDLNQDYRIDVKDVLIMIAASRNN